MKRLNKKGFTMAELLIVVAIIAVLVAIAIPVFTAQLEKSRDSVSVANMRAGYAEVMTSILAGTDGTNVTYDATAKTYTISVEIKSQSNTTAWSGLGDELPWIDGTTITAPPTDPGTPGSYDLVFTVGADGSTITNVALN